ncbi:MAG: extracellular solute-binding protein, partial [Lachnospiraceae bacterium]|nr:extracellular solute-binding protein [Lachnospiraceae bacterium]
MCVFNKSDPQEVLASWLFAQFMLTNEVQIAYSQTEGYAPVTSKAQTSAEYQEYLSRAGEDNELYYEVKLKATGFLLDNIDNTFVTPVFNGSASLRDAAGQLIENTVKAVRINQTVDEAYMEKLYSDTIALYRLDQLENQSGATDAAKEDLGPLPQTSIVLISVLTVAWVLIGLYVLRQAIKKRKNEE